jgi:hypothetical protein
MLGFIPEPPINCIMANKSEFNKEKVKAVVTQMRLPVSFDVLNTLAPEGTKKPYVVVHDSLTCLIHFRRVYETRFQSSAARIEGNTVKTDQDRTSNYSHSIIQFWFYTDVIDSDRINKDLLFIIPEQFLILSLDCLNTFIHHYKIVTGEFWLRPMIAKDVFNFDYIIFDENDNRQQIWGFAGGHVLHFNGGKEFKLEDKQESELRERLISDRYDFRSEVYYQMIDNYELGNFNNALIQSVTLFENFVYSNIADQLSRTKMNKFKKKECGCLVGISEMCTRGLFQLFQFDFEATPEWQIFRDNCLRLRNKIVHGQIIKPITKDECKVAIDSSMAAQYLLNRDVFNNTGRLFHRKIEDSIKNKIVKNDTKA